MRITITKGNGKDMIGAIRDDRSRVSMDLPHKGPVPHDVTHLLVERELEIADGFWGKVARGADPGELGAIAKSAGHPSAKRAALPDPSIAGIVQAERVVESFEADLWSNGSDNDALRSMADAGCGQSLVPPLALSDAAIEAIRAELRAFRDRWDALSEGECVELEWAEAMASDR